MQGKKAQAAMEFLMTYGWAILVVLIAIGALAYFGVLNPDRFLPEKCVISTGSGLFCDDHSAAAATGITLRIQNILTEDVVITPGVTGVVIDLSGGVTCTTSATSSYTITPDSTQDVVVGTGCTLTSGQKVKGDITIVYTAGTGGLTKTTTGQIVTTAA